MMRIDFDKLRAGLRRALSPRVALAVGVMVGGAAGLWALESHSGSIPTPAQGACCVSSVALGDTMMIPAVGADKDFFEVPSSPPSVMFLMGNNETMQFFPDDQFLPEDFTSGFYPASSTTANGRRGFIGAKEGDFVNTGCTDPALVAKMSWFDKNNTDPALNGSIIYDKDSDFPAPFFEPDKFYHTLGNRIAVTGGLTGGDYPYSLDGGDDYTFFRNLSPTSSTLGACYEVVGWNTSDYYSASTELMDECQACLSSVGWWRGPLITPTTVTPSGFQGGEYPPARLTQITGQAPPPVEATRKWVLNGRILNLHPPKFVVARKVLKDVINLAPNVRMGVASFGKDHGWYDPPFVIEGMRPSCDKSFPTINEEALNRPKLMSAVNSVWFGHNERAVGESLFGIGGYFSSQRRDNKWSNWFTNPINPGAFGWPGCCDGGTYDEPPGTPGHTGYDFAVRSPDEWIKPDEFVGGKYLPGQPFEDWDYNNRVVCFACQVNSVIVLTDGTPKYDNSVPITKMMQLLVAKGAHHPDGSLLTFDPSDPEHNLASGGVNYCDQFEKSPGVKFTKADCDYGPESYNWPIGLATGNKNFMDDVAFFLANMDLRDDLPGNQTLRTYTIGYGDNSAMLQSIALAGKGKFYRANNSSELRNSILDALGDIRQLSTSFASASVSGVQTGGQSSTYVPRFVPRQGRPYEGHLFRFFYYSEFAQGCQPDRAKSTAGDPYDLNHDKDCDDTFYVDRPSGFVSGVPDITSFSSNNIVQENTDGTWVKVNTATPLDGGRIEGGTPAEPFWDLGDTVGKRKAALPCDLNDPLGANKGRCIFTMIDRDNDGKFTDLDNPPIEFHESNLAQLQPYLLSGGDAFCSTLYAKQKKAWKGDPTQQTDCALQLIRFVRGMDVFDYDGDSNYDEERPCKDSTTDSCKLADIFHSTPVTVDPPIEPFLCSLGLSTQCMSTLYDDFSSSVTADPLCSSGSGVKPCYRPTLDPLRNSTNRYGAYDVYRHATPGRDRVLLIGSNGGMLHAVHAGSPTGRTKSGVLDDTYDIGTGQEMWAFIPPDLLPKLGLMTGEHDYFVDGTPMVRDIWADGAPLGTLTDRKKDGTKDPQEFRSIAIITERGGGQRYTALDLTDPYAIFKAVKGDTSVKPFRWMFPNACQPESLSMGQSWSNFAPKPPPIGPVRLAPSATSAAQDTDRGYEERWVAVLNGGYSSDLSRGRGIYMVDAWTGEELWAAEAKPGFRAGEPYDDLLNQMGPVVASAALVDIGKAESVQLDMDGYFDTLVVGDMLGQGWTFRFRDPGLVDPATGLVTNWFGSRSLEMARQDGTSAGPANLFEKQPIFHIAANVLQPETGWLRSFMGTGDRQHLRAVTGQDCSADDLLACIRLKCNVKATLTGEVNGQKRTSVIEYVGGVLQGNSEAWTATTGLACTGSRMDLTELKLSCPDAALGSAIFPPTSTGTSERIYNAQSWCAASGGNWTCDHINLNTSEHHDQLLSSTEMATVPANRFFGYHAYGGNKRIFKDKASAVAFDALRVTDKPGLTCAGGVPCSLVDVTIPDTLYNYLPADSLGIKQRYINAGDISKLNAAKTEDPGWFVRYNNSPLERSASGSTVLAGVVFWSTFAPSTGSGASVCSLSGLGDLSYSWQADVITGLPDQASSFQVRNSSGTVIGYIDAKPHGTSAPPGEPAPIVSLSKTGGIRYEVSMSSPGAAPSTETLASQANVTPDISWSEVPRNLHECRHVNAQACK